MSAILEQSVSVWPVYTASMFQKKNRLEVSAQEKTCHPIIHWPPPQTSSVKAERLRKQKQNGGGRGRRVRNSPSRAYSYLCTTRYPLPRLSDRIRPLELPVEKAYLQQLYMVTLSAQLLLTHILFLVWISQKLLANENRDRRIIFVDILSEHYVLDFTIHT